MRRMRISDMTDKEYRSYKNRRRVAAKARINMVRLVAAVMFALVIVIGCRFAAAKVGATNKIEAYKFYKTVTMKYDQTLSDVADEYFDEHYDNVEEFLDEIKSINHVNENSAMAGGKLLYIPYYDIPEAE